MSNELRKYLNLIESKLLDVKTPTVDELVEKFNVSKKHILKQLRLGMNIESEHTTDPKIQREIALDHLNEDPNYYEKLRKMEKSAE